MAYSFPDDWEETWALDNAQFLKSLDENTLTPFKDMGELEPFPQQLEADQFLSATKPDQKSGQGSMAVPQGERTRIVEAIELLGLKR